MKIKLPLETWTEMFGFVPRAQLVQLVTQKRKRRGKKWQIPIEDRQFVSFVQFFLHKCGQITLGNMEIISKSPPNGNESVIVNAGKQEWPLPDVQMPENIKDFKEIHISSYDQSVQGFLRKFQRNSLFTNVNLILVCTDAHLFAGYLDNILPLIDSVYSVSLRGYIVLDLFQNECHEEAMRLLALVRLLYAWYNFLDDWYCEWLYTPREDGKPRVLVLNANRIKLNQLIPFVERVKKDFVLSRQAISFCIHIYRYPVPIDIESLSLDNWQTNEKLVINGEDGHAMISRYPMGANEEWIKEMGNHSDWKSRKIVIDI